MLHCPLQDGASPFCCSGVKRLLLTGGVLQLTFLSGSGGVLPGGGCASLSGGDGGGVVPPFLSLSLFSISDIISVCQILRSSSGMRTNLSLSGQDRVLNGASGILYRDDVSLLGGFGADGWLPLCSLFVSLVGDG